MATAQTLLISQDDPISFGFLDWSQIGRTEAMTTEDLDVLFGPDPTSTQDNEQSFRASYPPSQEEVGETSSLSPGTSQAQFTPSSTLQGSFQDEGNGEDEALELVAASTTSPADEYELSPFSSHSSNYSYSFPHGSESALTSPFANEPSGNVLSSSNEQSWQSFTSSEGDLNHPALQPSTTLGYAFSGLQASSNVAFNDTENFLTNFHLPLRTLPSSQPWLPTTIQSFTPGPSWGNFQHSTELQQQGHVVPLPQNSLLQNPHMMQDPSTSQMPVTSGPSHSTFTWAPRPPFEGQQAADLPQHNLPATQSHATSVRLAPNNERIQNLQQTKDTITKRKQATRNEEKTKQQGSTGSKRSERPLAVASSPTTPDSREGHSDSGPKPVRGGRKKHTHLNPQARQRSSAMRKMGACWRCKLQRDPCPDDGSPCGRCLHVMEKHNGPHVFFACDRSKLPDFVFDFLPPSYTVMHSKQNIEDTVQDQVRLWDLARPINVFFTSGFGHPLSWTLYEFQPSTVELLAQFQYLQNTQTRQSERFEKWSPPLGIIKLEPSDDWHFKNYLDELMMDEHLMEFPWTCFEEESQFDNFQADMLALICQLYRMTPDQDLRSLLHKIIRMMIITYIMGHTLTITQETLPAVHYHLRNPNKPHYPAPHTSPRLANRQLKFFFHVLRHQIFEEILKWQQATFQTAGSKDSTWLSSFLVILALAMVLEEAQRTMQIQADAKARKRECSYDGSQQEARNACERIDERFALLVGLFQCKYRDKKWLREGSFGPQTPRLRCPVAHDFCQELRGLLMEKQYHLRTRKDVPFSSQNQCFYTSRLVARFLLPFLNLPA